MLDTDPEQLFGLSASDRTRLERLLRHYERKPLNQRPQRRRGPVIQSAPSASPAGFSGAFIDTGNNQQTIPNNSFTLVGLQLALIDTSGFFNSANSSLTIPAGMSGYYLVGATVTFSGNSNKSRGLWVTVNSVFGSITPFAMVGAADSSQATGVSASALLRLSAGDVVQLQVFQDSGSPLGIGFGFPQTALWLASLNAASQ